MSAALLTGCKNDDSGTTEQPTDAPEIEVGAQTPQTIPAEGGTVTLAYEIVNPVQGASSPPRRPKSGYTTSTATRPASSPSRPTPTKATRAAARR